MREGVTLLVSLILLGSLAPVAAGMHVPDEGALTFVFTDRVHPSVDEGLEMRAEDHDPPEDHLEVGDRTRLWVAEEATEVRFTVEPQTVEAQLHLSKEGSPGWINVTVAVGQVTDGRFEAAGETSVNESPGWNPGVRTYEVELEETQVFEPASGGEDGGDAPAAEVSVTVEDLSEGGTSLGVGIESGIEYEEDVPPVYPTPELPTLLLTVLGLSALAAGVVGTRLGPSREG